MAKWERGRPGTMPRVVVVRAAELVPFEQLCTDVSGGQPILLEDTRGRRVAVIDVDSFLAFEDAAAAG